jgi:hypothetical protein
MKQPDLVFRRSGIQFPAPFTNQLPQVLLSSPEFLDLVPEGAQFLLGEGQHPTARDAAVIMGSENVGEFVQRKTEGECSPGHSDPLYRSVGIGTVSTVGSVSLGEDTQFLVVPDRVGANAGEASHVSGA